jgi:hypothetical protein
MNGNLMYEVAKQRMAERHQAASRARDARAARDAARGRNSGEVTRQAIPDFVHELLAAIPAARPEDERGRRTRAGR